MCRLPDVYLRAWHVEKGLSLGAAACSGRLQPHTEAAYEILLSLRVAGLEPAWRQSSTILLGGAAASLQGGTGRVALLMAFGHACMLPPDQAAAVAGCSTCCLAPCTCQVYAPSTAKPVDCCPALLRQHHLCSPQQTSQSLLMLQAAAHRLCVSARPAHAQEWYACGSLGGYLS